MTQNYVNGFFTKCAEQRVPYDIAVALYKKAGTTGLYEAPVTPAVRAAYNTGAALGTATRAMMPGGKTEMVRRGLVSYLKNRATRAAMKKREAQKVPANNAADKAARAAAVMMGTQK
jgi:hypothetical protein